MWLFLYQVAGTLGFLVALPYVLFRLWRHPEEMRERLGWSAARPESMATEPVDQRPLWIHLASLGELEALSALWAEPGWSVSPPMVVTVLSTSARAHAARRLGAGVTIAHAPLDLWFAVLPFLSRVRPRGLLLLETEIWPLTLHLCRRRGIPVALISGRLSPRKWRRTYRFRALLGPAIRGTQACAVQSAGDAERFRMLGCSNVSITGNLKYRLETERNKIDGARDADSLARKSPLILTAGSVRTGEEAILDAVGTPGTLLVLAPRHLRDRDHWIQALQERGIGFVERSSMKLKLLPLELLRDPVRRAQFRAEVLSGIEAAKARRFIGAEDGASIESGASPSPGTPNTRSDALSSVLLVDVHGELSAWYAVADAAFVGGTLVPIGGHNLFEPAREGIPVAFGPHTGGVEDLAEPLLRTGGGTRVAGAAELAGWVRSLVEDPARRVEAGRAALEAAREVAGASARTWAFLETLSWVRVERPGKLDQENRPARISKSRIRHRTDDE